MELVLISVMLTAWYLARGIPGIHAETIDKVRCKWQEEGRDFICNILLNRTQVTDPEECKKLCLYQEALKDCFSVIYDSSNSFCRLCSDRFDDNHVVAKPSSQHVLYYLDCTDIVPVTVEPVHMVTEKETDYTYYLQNHPEYLAMIGLGILILLLLIIAIVSICTLSGRDRK